MLYSYHEQNLVFKFIIVLESFNSVSQSSIWPEIKNIVFEYVYTNGLVVWLFIAYMFLYLAY